MKRTLHKALSMLLAAAMLMNIGLTIAFAEGVSVGNAIDSAMESVKVSATPGEGDLQQDEPDPLKPPAGGGESECICPPADSDELVHDEGCPLYIRTLPATFALSTEIWDGTIANLGTDYMVDGSTYTILTPIGLAWIGTQIRDVPLDSGNYNWSYAKNFILGNDLDLSGREWIPIPNMYGNFDGNNKIIEGLEITKEAEYLGLFAGLPSYFEERIIKNLTIIGNIDISNATIQMDVGMLSGDTGHKVKIINCRTEGMISIPNASEDDMVIGGLIGDYYAPIIENCSSSVDINAVGTKGEIGGLISSVINPSLISNSYATGNIVGGISCGGLIGYISDSSAKISNCFASGDASTESFDAYVGGLIGYIRDGAEVSNCYSLGNTTATGTGTTIVGGIVGSNAKGNVSNCYSLGNATAKGKGTTIAGGIVGNNAGGKVEKCYAIGEILTSGSADLRVGGIVGNQAGADPCVENCVALNKSVTGSGELNSAVIDQVTSGTVVGRMGGTLTTNRAFEGIPVNGEVVKSDDLTSKHGLSVAGTSIKDFSSFEAFDKIIWTMTKGKLPSLTGVTQEEQEIPDYIVPKAILTVHISDVSRMYGVGNPMPNVTFEGFINGETESDLTGVLVFDYIDTITQESVSGIYKDVITASGLQSDDYKIIYSYVDGAGADLTITKIPVTITAGTSKASYLTIHLSEALAGLTTDQFAVTLGGKTMALTGVTASGDNKRYTLNGNCIVGSEYEVTVSTNSVNHEINGNPLSITPTNTSSGGGGTPAPMPPVITDSTLPENGNVNLKPTVDNDGNAAVTVSDKNIVDAIKNAQDKAKKNGTEKNGIAVTITLDTNKTLNSFTANLPKATREKLIAAGVTTLTIDGGATITLDLEAIKQMNVTANADVTVTVAKIANSTLSKEVLAATGGRAVYDFKVAGAGKTITTFVNGKITISIPYELQKVDGNGNPSVMGAFEDPGNLVGVYIDANGKVTYLSGSGYNDTSKSIFINTDHLSLYGVAYKTNAPAFTDTANHWAKDHIQFVAARGLLTGTTAATFSPNTSMTRGMFVTALGRLAGIDPNSYKTSSFTDVAAGSYYLPYAEWAVESNIVTGTSATTFAPNRTITRQEMSVMIANYAKAIGCETPGVHKEIIFTDSASIDIWAKYAVKEMQMAGILMGKDGGKFDPIGTATRAEASAMLHRFVELVAKTAE